MPYIKIPGFKGKLYIPEENKSRKKHDCKDCYSCQMCSDSKCSLCLKNKTRCNGNLAENKKNTKK